MEKASDTKNRDVLAQESRTAVSGSCTDYNQFVNYINGERNKRKTALR